VLQSIAQSTSCYRSYFNNFSLLRDCVKGSSCLIVLTLSSVSFHFIQSEVFFCFMLIGIENMIRHLCRAASALHF
jgi:hypothetical protein